MTKISEETDKNHYHEFELDCKGRSGIPKLMVSGGKVLASRMVSLMLDSEEASIDQQRHLQENNDIFARKLKKYNKLQPLKPIFEPVPCEEHIFCAVCEVKFDDYLTHIHSEQHHNCSKLRPFPEIDEVILELGEVQPSKKPDFSLKRKASQTVLPAEMTEPVSGSQFMSMMTESQTPATLGTSLMSFNVFKTQQSLKQSPKCIFLGSKRIYPHFETVYKEKITPKKSDASPLKEGSTLKREVKSY